VLDLQAFLSALLGVASTTPCSVICGFSYLSAFRVTVIQTVNTQRYTHNQPTNQQRTNQPGRYTIIIALAAVSSGVALYDVGPYGPTNVAGWVFHASINQSTQWTNVVGWVFHELGQHSQAKPIHAPARRERVCVADLTARASCITAQQ
jgi:hypothetical protein